jgi:fatty acid desaturase
MNAEAPQSGASALTLGASREVRRAFGPELVSRLEDLQRPVGVAERLDAVRDLIAIGAAATSATLIGGPVMPPLCALYIGFQQRRLSNLAHECIHAKLLDSNRANRALGQVIATLLGEPFSVYRRSHRVHHAKLGQPGDPMLESYVSREANKPHSSKLAFVGRAILRHAVSTLPRTAFRSFLPSPSAEGWRSAVVRALVWLSILAIACRINAVDLIALYWLGPLLVVRPLVTWITDLGNHAGVIQDEEVLRQTRGWTAGAVTRHLLGGHLDDMYHPIHHWFPNLPSRQLPQAAAVLAAGCTQWNEVPWCSGFFFRRRSTPDQPCVIEDIVDRLRSPAGCELATPLGMPHEK